jgi:arylsulfatase A-like enzyme
LAPLLLLTAVGCGGRSPAPPAPGRRPGPERLLNALGAPTFVRFRNETRPAVVFRSDEERSCAIDARSGRSLSFAWGIGPRTAVRGYVELRVSAGDEVLYRRMIWTGLGGRWWHASVPLGPRGPVRLTFRADHVHADGRRMALAGEAPAPWVVVASPRIDDALAEPGPAFVWLSQDTVRADHLSLHGYGRPTSSRFDRLAADWVLFDNAVATASWTLPSLASQFTSRYPLFHGAERESRRRDERNPTLFEVLAGAGFTVIGVTANDFVSSYFGMADGFDVLRFTGGSEGPEGRQRAEELNALVLQTLGEAQGGRLALFVHYMDPHYPYDPPPPFDRLFRGDEPAGQPAGRGRVEAAYDGEIAYTDAQIDLLLKELAGRGLLRDAVMAYTSDHGEEFLDHGGWRHSRTLYQEVLRVPFALRLPGRSGRRVTMPVSLVDLAPTLLDALGVAAPASFQGRSLLPLARGESLPATALFAETERNPDKSHRLAVRIGALKYILRTRNGGDPDQPLSEELYDLDRDPQERSSDLAHPQIESLRRQAALYLARGRAQAQAPAEARLPADLKAQLHALGYLQ